jgi:hypothetical protein
LLAGCAKIDNDRLTVGPENVSSLSGPQDAQRLTPARGPSITSIGREDWEPVTITVWTDGVQHNDHLTDGGPHYTRAAARQRAESPTVDSSHELGLGGGAQAVEGLAAPFRAAWDVVMFLPRGIAAGSETRTSPRDRYERGLHEDCVSPPLAPESAPIESAAPKAGS